MGTPGRWKGGPGYWFREGGKRGVGRGKTEDPIGEEGFVGEQEH